MLCSVSCKMLLKHLELKILIVEAGFQHKKLFFWHHNCCPLDYMIVRARGEHSNTDNGSCYSYKEARKSEIETDYWQLITLFST